MRSVSKCLLIVKAPLHQGFLGDFDTCNFCNGKTVLQPCSYTVTQLVDLCFHKTLDSHGNGLPTYIPSAKDHPPSWKVTLP